MSLISYDSLEDGTPITANVFNERFGQIIAVLNGGLDQNNFATGGIPAEALAASVYEQIYPVGSLYFNSTDNTNPADLLGFGTWSAFGAGRVPVGYDSSNENFDAAEKTGGEETHVLTTGELPAHTHTVNPPATSTNSAGDHAHQTFNTYHVAAGVNTATGTAGDGRGNNTTTNGAHSHTVDIPQFNSGSVGSGTAHNNLQPFVTVYIWKRTA